jgi:opacity protein-like surface antigen
MLALALALVMLPAAAQAKMWVGAQLGANFVASTDVTVTGVGTFSNATVEPSVIAGLTIGYDFVREGFLGYNYPDWMKYFSFATDFTFNRLDFRQQFRPPLGVFPLSEGTQAVWSFLFMFKYGFLPDSDVPFGRLQPYIAVGPGIAFSTLSPAPVGSSDSTDIVLVTEAGLRYMALKNVSLDAAFRYRYSSPSYSFTGFNVEFDANQFSALFRVSYHF